MCKQKADVSHCEGKNHSLSPSFHTLAIFQLQNLLIKGEDSALREESWNATTSLYHSNYLTPPPKPFLRAKDSALSRLLGTGSELTDIRGIKMPSWACIRVGASRGQVIKGDPSFPQWVQ